MLSCEGAQYLNDKSAPALQNQESFLGKGGRVLATHFHNGWIQNAQPPQKIQTVATFGTSAGPDPVTDTIDVTLNMGSSLASWLSQDTAMGSPAAGQLPVKRPGYTLTSLNSSLAQRWIYYQPAMGPAVPQSFSFAAPVNTAPAKRCDKMLFSDVHAGSGPGGDSSTAGPPFPAEEGAGSAGC